MCTESHLNGDLNYYYWLNNFFLPFYLFATLLFIFDTFYIQIVLSMDIKLFKLLNDDFKQLMHHSTIKSTPLILIEEI